MPRRSDKLWSELSDESSFYGNDEERSQLEELVRNNDLESSSSKSKRKFKSKTKMSGAEPDSDADAVPPPRERPSRRKGKEKASTSTDSKSASKPKKRSSKKSSETNTSGPASEPAKASRREKSRAEDQRQTSSDASAPEPKKRSSAKKRKADGPEPAVSDSAPPPRKKAAQKAESPESTDSGSPSPSPPREQPPNSTGEQRANEADESTEDPEEFDSDNEYLSDFPDEADIVIPPPNVDLLGRRRANQPMSDLIASMPPSTSNMHDTGPWIVVTNPHYKGRRDPDATSFWVEASDTILGGYYPGTGMPMRRQGGHDSSMEMTRTRQFMERNILALARRKGIVMGKWLLFLTLDRLDYAWNVIAQATERGELGPSAKVATDDGSGKTRMIAVYTKDFNDVADVRRVAQKLMELGMIKAYDKPIYYKTDAYTHLEINHNNPWGLKASMYNSRDILAGRY